MNSVAEKEPEPSAPLIMKKESPVQVNTQPATPSTNDFMVKRAEKEKEDTTIPVFGEDGDDWSAVPAFLRRQKK